MGKSNDSAADHDPGDEDPTERVKRALLELLNDRPTFAPYTPPPELGEARAGHSILSLPYVASPWPWLI